MTINADEIARLTMRYRSTAAELSASTGWPIASLYIDAMKIAASDYPYPPDGHPSSASFFLVNQIMALRHIRGVFLGRRIAPK